MLGEGTLYPLYLNSLQTLFVVQQKLLSYARGHQHSFFSSLRDLTILSQRTVVCFQTAANLTLEKYAKALHNSQAQVQTKYC